MKSVTRRRLKFVAGFAAYFAALWFLWDTPAVYPLRIFVVLLHEISHGLAAVATGGSIVRIGLSPDEGGVTYTLGGNAFLTLSAGYLGSLAWGLALIEAARARAKRIRVVTAGLGALLLLMAILFVRGWFGWIFTLLAGAVLLLAARRLSPRGQAVLLTTLGATSALYAVLDIRSDVLQRPHLESDAHLLMELTGVPTLVWGVVWIAVALAACGWMLWRRYLRP
ncbi:MAG TPA: M50 family metallopeptidase [Longimicrobiales bacterium]|nr:M50 family metallopeptidase [Longimicrobiales bacterium]